MTTTPVEPLPTLPVNTNGDQNDIANTVPPSSPLVKPVTESRPIDFKKYAVVVAIDFGTTFSGCSYAFAEDENIQDITKWHKYSGFYSKTPTLLLYKHKPLKVQDWGNGARLAVLKPNTKDSTLLKCFKLHLSDNQEYGELPPLIVGSETFDPIRPISDYLKLFHQNAMEELRKGFANNIEPERFRYCLTVPAIWSDRAKTSMREAALRSGIISRDDPVERLILISEPEAAALYCEKRSESWNLQHGDKFMIVDAGGGTVDLIVYEIEHLDPKQPRTLKELTKGQGGLCGGAYIDENMRKLLRSKLKRYIKSIPACAFEIMMDEFVQTIKPEFNGKDTQYLQLPASAQCDQTDESIGLENGILLLTADELNDRVFKPVINRVIKLIDEQLRQCKTYINAIFMVGGFGSSNYLYSMVEKEFRDRVTMIASPPRGELAVVHGAVMHALHPNKVTSKIARRTYGVMTRMKFEEGLDPEDSAIITVDGVKRCSTRFDVYLRKGDRIEVQDHPIRKNFWISYPANTETDLYAYDGDGPIPRQVTDPGVRKIADFPIEIPHLPGVRAGDRVDLQIDFIFASTELRIEVLVKGQQMSFTSKLDSEDA
ncbi:hypothetical protein K450DRAFT_244957 [Umbelopsis ramanniana AG]|uniref:Uncharacterized protein n=1 Tax=Umbelopsis ramanniana AG TaxID=1314678 RepID=A0AAD5HED5_UMBRA|nr:uncharacterized protein K450DRAFT_244957 [Umbelopsis ramanniana AG]KAI8578883.1 hypothetical protein K450DRAFT_244957 [Umbelopsis ramanniana AG]